MGLVPVVVIHTINSPHTCYSGKNQSLIILLILTTQSSVWMICWKVFALNTHLLFKTCTDLPGLFLPRHCYSGKFSVAPLRPQTLTTVCDTRVLYYSVEQLPINLSCF